MYGEVETQFLLFGLLLHTQPLNSSEQHTRADLEFSSDFGQTVFGNSNLNPLIQSYRAQHVQHDNSCFH